MTGRCAEAVTIWAAVVLLQGREGFSVPSHPDMPEGWFQRQEPLREARQALGPAQAGAAEERGQAMSLATAAEYVLMLTATGPQPPTAPPGAEGLSPRERELVTLVARGLPLLIASGDGVLVNTSSVNGFWAALGPGRPNTAYATAKFAVRGFSEALVDDLRANAPQVRVAVVMPGHVATDIVANSLRARGLPAPEQMSDAQVEGLIPGDAQAALIKAGLLAEGASPDDLRQLLVRGNADFRDKAPVSAAEAATLILDGVRSGAWRILVGEDAKMIDAAVRAKPEAAYDYAELFSGPAAGPAPGTPEP